MSERFLVQTCISKQNCISGKLFDIITNFLDIRKVVLNGQHSSWTSIEFGVTQGLIHGPLVFLIYINDLSDDLTTILSFLLMTLHFYLEFIIWIHLQLNWTVTWAKSETGLQASFKRKIVIQFILITTPFNKFSLKNILECILILKFQEHLNNVLSKVNRIIWINAWSSSFFTAPTFNYSI